MTRWLLWLASGLLLGGIVHFVTILYLPNTATQNAYARISAVAPVNAIVPLPAPSAEKSILPLMDPAFAAAVCRYDLSESPIKLTAPVSPAYTSATFYTNKDVAYYAINDRAAGRKAIELELMTAAQKANLPDDEDVAAADRLIVESPSVRGLIVLRALAPEPGMLPAAVAALAGARCEPQPIE
jgi:uncharacterized membrane protein